MAIVRLEISDGTLSGIMTFTMIWRGEAPMLWAASMMLGLTSRMLDSTSRATKGNAATTRGTMVATVPTVVPTISRDSGNTMIIKIRNGMDRSRLMTTFKMLMSHLGSGRTPFLSPATSRTPRGSPMTTDRAVETRVT